MSQFEEQAASGRFFFRKQNRILKRADFQRVYNSSRPIRRSLVHVFIMAPADSEVGSREPSATAPGLTRLGITTTKKAGNSVRRNRARRLVRESFRLALPDLKPGYSIVINVMRAATMARYADVDKQLRDIFQHAGLFKLDDNSAAPHRAR